MKTAIVRSLSSAVMSVALLSFTSLASAQTTVITESVGTISEFSPDALVIRSETSTAPARYVVSKEVTYVDETGAPVDVSIVKSGAPVTVHYVKEADRMVARKVVVKRAKVASPVVTERVTTVPAAPVTQEKTSTTTTTISK